MSSSDFQANGNFPNSSFQTSDPKQFAAWAKRNEFWATKGNASRWRAKRERSREPLILCGHGVSLNIDRGTLLIRDGLTHYPQERAIHRLYRGDPALPPRILMLDGSGSLSFDVLAWLSEQNIPLVRIDWRGEIVSVIGGSSYAQLRERVAWQTETRENPERRLEFACDLIGAKLRASLKTLNAAVPDSGARSLAVVRCEAAIKQLARREAQSIDEVRSIEAHAAAAYFKSWAGLPLIWRSKGKYPIPDAWLTIGSARSSGRGKVPTNRNATHPLSAMLNYAYAALRSQIHIEAAAGGYDPCRGIMHHDRQDTQAFVYDLIEPRRPIADAAVLRFVLSTPFTGADFVLRSDGVCRLAPQLARRVAKLGMAA
jgi:CRISP-associated protein Cas1